MPTDGAGRRRAALALGVILLVALTLRIVGLGYGLPEVYNPDEVSIMTRALAFGQGDFNPHNFLYPTFYFYVLFLWEGLWFLAGRVIGVFPSIQAFERSFFVDPTTIYLAGRALTALLGVATVGATYALGRRLFGRVEGLVAAGLLAVAPLAVRDAHYVKHDVPVTCLIVITLAMAADLAVRSAGGGTSMRWAATGALAGLAMSTHYYAIFLAVPLLVAALLPTDPATPPAHRLRHLATAGVASAIAFLAGTPFLIGNLGIALRDIAANRAIVVDRATSAGGAFGSARAYAQWLTTDAMGWLTCALALGGLAVLVLSARSTWRRTLLLVSFPVSFLAFIANTVPASRYLNPVLPMAVVLAGVGGAWLIDRGRLARTAGAALVAVAAIQAGAGSWRTDLFFRETDTRTLARDWIVADVPAETALLEQPYSVPLRMSRAGLVEALTAHLGSADRASIKFQRELSLRPYPAPAYRVIFLGTGGLDVDKIYVAPRTFLESRSLAPLRALGVAYVILKGPMGTDPALAALVRALGQEATLVETFSPYRADVDPGTRSTVEPFLHNTDARITSALVRPGPVVEIWRVK